jgi:hypothetical protein
MKLNFKLILKPALTIHDVSKSDFSLEYFYNKYGVEIFSYPIFKMGKCNYDSYTKIGYQYQILQPNKGSKSCYHIDFRFFDIFPEGQLDMGDEDYNTFEKMGYEIYKTKKEAEENALKHLISSYYPKTTS